VRPSWPGPGNTMTMGSLRPDDGSSSHLLGWAETVVHRHVRRGSGRREMGNGSRSMAGISVGDERAVGVRGLPLRRPHRRGHRLDKRSSRHALFGRPIALRAGGRDGFGPERVFGFLTEKNDGFRAAGRVDQSGRALRRRASTGWQAAPREKRAKEAQKKKAGPGGRDDLRAFHFKRVTSR